jgi:DNA-binding SARP family transcriptional activator
VAHLSIHLPGPFHITLDGKPLTGFESNKVRALLAYLAVEADATGNDRPPTREALTGLLWPDQPDAVARCNLSQALFNLRQTIRDDQADPPFLDVTRGTARFNLEVV